MSTHTLHAWHPQNELSYPCDQSAAPVFCERDLLNGQLQETRLYNHVSVVTVSYYQLNVVTFHFYEWCMEHFG